MKTQALCGKCGKEIEGGVFSDFYKKSFFIEGRKVEVDSSACDNCCEYKWIPDGFNFLGDLKVKIIKVR